MTPLTRLSQLRLRELTGLAMACFALGLFGAVVAVAQGRLDVAIVLITAALLGVWVSIGLSRPELLLGLFIAAQPLEAFEVRTPVTTISVGNVLMIVLLLTNLRPLWSAIRASRFVRLAGAILVGWLIVFPLRALHDPPVVVLRQMVTMTSFVLVAATAVAVARRPGVLRAMAIGSFSALMILAIAGLLINAGVLPPTTRTGPARVLLGFTSPFMRTYGLEVPLDAVELLIPLCVPYFALRTLSSGGSGAERFASLVAVSLLGVAALLIFQGRGMLLQLAAGTALAVILVLPGRARLLAAVALAVTVAALAFALIKSDQVSSELRGGIDVYVVNSILANPGRFIFGVPEDALYREGAAQLGLQDFLFSDNPVHNFFLSNLVAGGFFAFALIVACHFLSLVAAVRLYRWYPSFESRTVLLAVALALLGLSLEPAHAGIIGSWLVLGLAIGRYGSVGRPGGGPPYPADHVGDTELLGHAGRVDDPDFAPFAAKPPAEISSAPGARGRTRPPGSLRSAVGGPGHRAGAHPPPGLSDCRYSVVRAGGSQPARLGLIGT